MTSKASNLFLNIGLVVVIAIAGILIYAFSQRVSTPRPDPFRLENPRNLLGDIIQVEVMNGTSISGLASNLTEHLRSHGFDVVETGNHSNQSVEKTVILDRVGNLDASEQVAVALGLTNDRIAEELKPEYFIDATIIIGADFMTVMPFVEQVDQEAAEEEPTLDSE